MVGPPGVWRESRDFQISFLKGKGLSPEHRLLDIGCGPLRGGVPLIRYLNAGNYFGLDIRPESIAEAKREIERERLGGKRPTVFVSSTFGAEELRDVRFDCIWCFQVLYHLSDDLARACLDSIRGLLASDGVCYANVNLVGEEGRWQEFPYLRRPEEFYQALAANSGLSLVNLGQQRDLGFTAQVPGRFNHVLELRPKDPSVDDTPSA